MGNVFSIAIRLPKAGESNYDQRQAKGSQQPVCAQGFLHFHRLAVRVKKNRGCPDRCGSVGGSVGRASPHQVKGHWFDCRSGQRI